MWPCAPPPAHETRHQDRNTRILSQCWNIAHCKRNLPMIYVHCVANLQEAEGRFLRLWAWKDAGGAADDTWCHPDMQCEDAPEVADIRITDRPGDLCHA